VHRALQRTTMTLSAAALIVVGLAAPALADGPPAGGVPTEDLIPAAIVGTILVAFVAFFGWAHRTGQTTLLTRSAQLSEKVMGLPGYAALPFLLVGGSLLIAVFGFYWDVSTHIDNGRDPGPFANPSHWFIIFGLLGIALAGVLCLLLGVDEDHPTGVKLRDGWKVPIGGLLLAVCGVIALLGFPLDDVWHRIFGQDVTLWSPTHIQMVGGASLATLCMWILVGEARRAPDPSLTERWPKLLDIILAGSFLIGASTLQAEFDYAVPQFRLLYQPVLVMVAAGLALVAARIRLGPWGAVQATAVFLLVRVALTLLVTPMMGRTMLHFPLYLGAALAVELIARFVDTDRQVTFGAIAGLAIGTLGLAAEWLWTVAFMPINWPLAMLPETLAIAVPAAIGAGVIGGYIGRALAPPEAPRQQAPTWVAVAVGVVTLAALVYPIPMMDEPGATATVVLDDIDTGAERTVAATITLDPPTLGEGANYVNVTAWQGAQWRRGVHSFADPLERVEQGVYRTTRPIPVHGQWKALIRVHDGRTMIAAPIFLPEDAAIPAEEVPADSEFTREFVLGQELLLREEQDAPAWLTATAYFLTLALIAAWIAGVGWGIRHLRRRAMAAPRRPAGPGRPAVGPQA
jgi:hypothetical protein